jgi:glycosyltransferase involved in cell wall biosynthesis
MSLVFINNTAETFTPTQSGALATIICECCREANGARPLVLTRSSEAAPFAWKRSVFLDYPKYPRSRIGVLLGRAERKLFGWRDVGQRAYAHRVLNAIGEADVAGLPLLLMNDPETTVLLRDSFPRAMLVHWFQNQLECKGRFRARFKGAPTKVLAVSDFTARWVERYYGLPAYSVDTVHNGVNVDQFHPPDYEPPTLPVINFVGRTGIEKAPDLLLQAALKLSERTTDFAVQMIGSNHWGRLQMDDYQRKLLELADRLEARGVRVHRPGHIGRDALPAELRKAHIHVVPSRWDEPCALAILEGMATGLAVVASRTGGTPELVGDAGFLFERESLDELAGHLGRLVSDHALRVEYGRKARQRAMQFTWKHTWQQLREASGV